MEPDDDAAGLVDEAHDREAGDGLAGPRFADEAEHLALVDREADAVDGRHDARAGEEVGAEVADFEDGGHAPPLRQKPLSMNGKGVEQGRPTRARFAVKPE